MEKVLLPFLLVFILVACNNNHIIYDDSEDVSPVRSGESSNNETQEPENEDLIKDMISKMTLEDKIEQMLVLDYSMVPYSKEGEKDASKLSSQAKDIIKNHNIGGIILFRDNIKGTKQTLELINDFQQSATKDNAKYNISLLMCVDQEGGNIIRLSTGTSMPGNMALGALNYYDTTVEYSSIIGEELNALGFNVDFAPVMDVNNNPSNPIIGVRSFSSDTSRVSNMGKAFIEGLHSQNIMSTLKHFPGHGDTATDSHTGLPLINKTYEDIKAQELIPFKAGIDKGADMIMTAHIVYPQIEKTKYTSKKTGEEITLPATLSKTILTDILRNDLGFDGVIVTDALNMSAIAEHYDKKDVAKYALNAGVDILLMPVSLLNDDKLDEYVNMVSGLVQSGDIDESRINESVERIIKLKQKYGLLSENDFELTDEKVENALKVVGSEKHHETELKIAKDIVTLIKGKELLPIIKEEKVLFLNAYENEKNNMEYAIELLKKQGTLDDSFKYEIANYQKKDFSSLKSKVSDATIVVITSNSYNSKYFDNNNEDNGWQGRFIDKAIAEIHKQNKKVVLVSCMLPYDIVRYNDADVIVCCYGDRAISELPIVYNGETKTFGLNMSSAIIKLFSNEEFKATLPVDAYKIDKNYKYTDEIVYKVGD